MMAITFHIVKPDIAATLLPTQVLLCSFSTFRSKAVLEPAPVAEVELISPLPSPADPLPRAQKRVKEGEAPTSSMNLRRKRIMDTVFTKPVTRRKKL